MSKRSLLLSLYIGQIFIWTGSAFMTILYYLCNYYDGAMVTLITEGLFYIMQAVGIIAFSFLYKYRPRSAGRSLWVTASILFLSAITTICLFQHGEAPLIFWGCLMNIGIGVTSGQLFTRIALYIPQNEHGKVFGIAYAAGSVGTYLISLLNNGQGLTASYIPYLYLAMMALSLLCSRFLKDNNETECVETGPSDMRLLLLAFAVPFMCHLVYSLGYHFATMDMSSGVNPAFTRAFYAFSLIIAGIINDKNRKTGSILGFLILVFPFVSLALRNAPGTATLLCILSYLFLGFLSVFHVILFTDISTRSPRLIYMAPYGLMLGSLGTAAGTTAEIIIDKYQILVTLLTAALFILCGILFALLFAKMHLSTPMPPAKSEEKALYDFQVKYSLNANQMEILRMILRGNSNGQIASELHLAESTIKYHVKNILKATDCSNRNDLISLFHDFCM